MKRAVLTLALSSLLSLWAVAQPASLEEALRQGDAAWERRTEGHEGIRAQPEPIAEAIAAYEAALKLEPKNIQVHWRLMRALYFQGEFVEQDSAKQQAIFSRATDLFATAVGILQQRLNTRTDLLEGKPEEIGKAVRGVPEAPALYFLGAVAWGSWGEAHGRMAAVRKGVAGKVRDYSEVVILLDETFEQAGGHRVLGRLHAVAPSVIFFTGWVDRDKAVEHLTRAVELAPGNPDNRAFYAEALLENRKEKKQQALAMLRQLLAEPIPAGKEMEMERSRKSARELLKKYGGGS